LIRERNIVCVASNWFEHPTSKHHVMRLLSEQNHIVWVNYHASRRPNLNRSDSRMILRRLREACAGARRVSRSSSGTIDVLSPLLLPLPESPTARHLNAGLLIRQIRGALRQLPGHATQLWLFTPDTPELIEPLGAEKVVYYCVDDFAAFAGYNAELVTGLEQRTIAACDVVITSSETLYRRCRRQHANAHLVPHGVDLEHFASAADARLDELPGEVRDIPKPIFGYIGLISDYVDLDLIAGAARRQPKWSFVLIGSARCDTSALDGLANVYLLGRKPYEDLPGYCRAFDVGLIPFRMSRLTSAVNPIKLREYLAAGLPVVSAPMPEVLRYAPAVQTAETLDQFIAACVTTLTASQDGNAAGRRALVQAESWRARVEQLSQIIMATGNESGAAECVPASAG
jgi:glycosyltransferase involved in cell wall biosynthesis